jgi:ADP-ribose pyrophosphatase YjhB (NUDIX family)
VWKALPIPLRRRILLLTQATFTLGVTGVVVDTERGVLLMRNRLRESSGWELPGGFVDRDETLESALIREIRQETGLEIEVVGLLSTRIARPEHVDVCYACRVTGGTFRIDNSEVLAARYFAADALPAQLPPDQAQSVEAALRLQSNSNGGAQR